MNEYAPEVFSLATVALGYLVFTIMVRQVRSVSGDDTGKNTIRNFIIQKSLGVLIYGILPAAAYILIFGGNLRDIGLRWVNSPIYFLILAIVIPIVAIIASKAAKNPEQLKVYPLMRIREWTGGYFFLSVAGWGAYIFSYEFLLRGLLLYLWLPSGIWTAVIINITVYFLMHIAKGMREALSSVVFGIILCLLTIKSGSIIPAFLLHVSLSISTEWFSIKYNPDMSFIKSPAR